MNTHYFASAPLDRTQCREISVNLLGVERHVLTAPGVFSNQGLDKATAILLEEIARIDSLPTGASVLDLGCGWGAIALSLALKRADLNVYAVDVNEAARELTKLNAERLGVGNQIRVLAPEEVASSQRFAAIWSNPPIRIGKLALHELLLMWLNRLEPTGEAVMVVGKNLGADSLQKWISTNEDLPGLNCEKLASSKGFRILRACAAAR